MSTLLTIITVAVILIAVVIIAMYNGLIRQRNEVDNAYGGIDIQLKKRYDLIPNMVATLNQYASHEKELLTKVTELRSRAAHTQLSTDEKVTLDNQISAEMKSIMVAVENYPDLKASENFINLQHTLNEVESQISAARRTYNAVITDYNNSIQAFPHSIMAAMMKMTKKEVFVIPETERNNVNVKSLFSL